MSVDSTTATCLPSNGASDAPPPGSSSSNHPHSSSSISSSIPNDPEFYFSHLLFFTSDIHVRLKSLLPPTTGEATPWLPGNHNAHHQRDLFSLHLGAAASAKRNDLDINPFVFMWNTFQCQKEDGNQKLKKLSALNRLCQNILFMLHSSEEGLQATQHIVADSCSTDRRMLRRTLLCRQIFAASWCSQLKELLQPKEAHRKSGCHLDDSHFGSSTVTFDTECSTTEMEIQRCLLEFPGPNRVSWTPSTNLTQNMMKKLDSQAPTMAEAPWFHSFGSCVRCKNLTYIREKKKKKPRLIQNWKRCALNRLTDL